MFRSDLLAGKKALITGGGTGLGKSIARRYLELGAEIVICGRRTEVLEATAKELREATGGNVSYVGCDVRKAESVEAMFDEVWRERPLDILINNAAQTVRRPAGFYTHLMENEERSIGDLPQQAQDLLLDHTN